MTQEQPAKQLRVPSEGLSGEADEFMPALSLARVTRQARQQPEAQQLRNQQAQEQDIQL